MSYVSALQVSKLKTTVREVSERLANSQRQHDQAMESSKSKLQLMNAKLQGANSEVSVLKAALETAALENEAKHNEISGLQKDLEFRTNELGVVRSRPKPSLLHSLPTFISLCATSR